MSRVRANNFTDKAGTGAPTLPYGVTVTGVSTIGNVVVGGATTDVVINGDLRVTGIITTGTASITIDAENDSIRVGSATTIHTTGIDLGSGNITSHNIISTGIITASSFSGDGSALTGIDATSLKDDGGNIKVQANGSGAVVTGVLTATSFQGDGSSLTGIESDRIFEGDSSVEVVDTGSDAYVRVLTDNGERLRIDEEGIDTNFNIYVKQSTTRYNMMRGGQSYNIYVSNSGDDANDGLTSGTAVRNLTRAWQLLPKLGYNGQVVSIRIVGNYTVSSTQYLIGGWANGDWEIGPYINFMADSGTVTVTMSSSIVFKNCSGFRFTNINFYFAGQTSLTFDCCQSCRLYNNCTVNSDATSGWSSRINISDCKSMIWEANITISAQGSAGLGGFFVIRKSTVGLGGAMTKSGTRFANHAISICDGSFLDTGMDVNNFNTGFAYGLNHYNAEAGSRGMHNGSTIQNCVTGILLYNHSYVKSYSVSYSGNTNNTSVNTNGGAFS